MNQIKEIQERLENDPLYKEWNTNKENIIKLYNIYKNHPNWLAHDIHEELNLYKITDNMDKVLDNKSERARKVYFEPRKFLLFFDFYKAGSKNRPTEVSSEFSESEVLKRIESLVKTHINQELKFEQLRKDTIKTIIDIESTLSEIDKIIRLNIDDYRSHVAMEMDLKVNKENREIVEFYGRLYFLLNFLDENCGIKYLFDESKYDLNTKSSVYKICVMVDDIQRDLEYIQYPVDHYIDKLREIFVEIYMLNTKIKFLELWDVESYFQKENINYSSYKLMYVYN